MIQGINLLYLIIVFISILISMTLHEAIHAFVSYWLGDDTAKIEGRLTLNPIAHIDPITTVLLPLVLVLLGAPPFGAAKPVPFNPNRLKYGDYGAALVGVAGPISNLFLAIFAGLILRLLPIDINSIVITILSTFMIVNISFFLFNMIPFPPLDGSRVLYAFAPDAVRLLMEKIESLGFVAIVFFMIIFYNFLIAPFSSGVGLLIRLISGQ